ncbi:MAG: thiamine-phosphate kinase [Ichthyobacteriaceae bacterium]|nr:thiamine-phosphate kinase [Ichthyobacteriaceae bacterium]
MIEDKQPQRTSISELGEFGLIDYLTKNIELVNSSTKFGIGDDCAILEFGDKQTLISTDLLVENVHFDLSYMPLKHLGYKAVMVNLSDVYSMMGKATQITVSLALSNRFPVEAVDELYDGMKLACKKYNVDLIGGDTTSSNLGLVISITAIGEIEKDKAVKRNGAKIGDLVVVSGDLGAAYMGLQVLEREKAVYKVNPNSQPDLSGYDYIIERQLKPEARKDVPPLLNELEIVPTSMIDISDGLSSEILHITKQSEVGCNLYEDKLPIDPTFINVCEEFKLDTTTIALNGGEDYELLFTIPQTDFDKIKGNPNFSIIGHITDKNSGVNLITRGGESMPIQARGFNHMEK